MSARAPHSWKQLTYDTFECVNCPCKKKDYLNANGIHERLYYLGTYTYVHAPECKGYKGKKATGKGKKDVKKIINIYEQLGI